MGVNFKLEEVLKGDRDAISLCESLLYLSHVWDDLIDGDPTEKNQINTAFRSALVNVPRNPFYQRNFTALQQELERSIYNWMDANILEKEGKLAASYVLRCSFDNFIIKCAEIVGGHDWARNVSITMRREIYNDFEDYVREHHGMD